MPHNVVVIKADGCRSTFAGCTYTKDKQTGEVVVVAEGTGTVMARYRRDQYQLVDEGQARPGGDE